MGEIMSDKKKKEVKKEPEVTGKEFNELVDIVGEIQQNVDFINDRLARVLERMGLE
tara:strand:- start:509 stop:676 length:168 start_codon:yes stop_codon:yes gene_type:complete